MLSITAVASSLPWRYKNNKMQNELKKENFKFYPIKDSELEGHKKSRSYEFKNSKQVNVHWKNYFSYPLDDFLRQWQSQETMDLINAAYR